MAGEPQIEGSPQSIRWLQFVGLTFPYTRTPELAFAVEIANPKLCPFETVASTVALAVKGGVKDARLSIVPTSWLALI